MKWNAPKGLDLVGGGSRENGKGLGWGWGARRVLLLHGLLVKTFGRVVGYGRGVCRWYGSLAVRHILLLVVECWCPVLMVEVLLDLEEEGSTRSMLVERRKRGKGLVRTHRDLLYQPQSLATFGSRRWHRIPGLDDRPSGSLLELVFVVQLKMGLCRIVGVGSWNIRVTD